MQWEQLLLQSVRSLGGKASLPDLYSWLERQNVLTAKHLRSTIYGGRPAYQHQVRSHISNLCEQGTLVRVAPGVYALCGNVCFKCGAHDWGSWTSASTRKVFRYCRKCRRGRARTYSGRKAANGGSHTQRQWESKLALYADCPGCDRPWKKVPPRPDSRYRNVWTKDHIVPVSQGGTDNIDNIQPLCYQCNSAKCDALSWHGTPNRRMEPTRR